MRRFFCSIRGVGAENMIRYIKDSLCEGSLGRGLFFRRVAISRNIDSDILGIDMAAQIYLRLYCCLTNYMPITIQCRPPCGPTGWINNRCCVQLISSTTLFRRLIVQNESTYTERKSESKSVSDFWIHRGGE